MSKVEVRCDRCDDHILTWEGGKVILMQHEHIEVKDGTVLDEKGNEIIDGDRRVLCGSCTNKQRLDFRLPSPENIVPRPEEMIKKGSKKFSDWINKQLVDGRREFRFPKKVVELAMELFPINHGDCKRIDNVTSPQGRELNVYEWPRGDKIIRMTFLEEPETAKLGVNDIVKDKYGVSFLLLFACLVGEQGSREIVTSLPFLQKIVSGKKKAIGGWQRQEIERLCESLAASSWRVTDRNTGRRLWQGYFIELGPEGVDDDPLRILVSEKWQETWGQFYLSSPTSAFLDPKLPRYIRVFAKSLMEQRGKPLANITVEHLIEPSYSPRSMRYMSSERIWKLALKGLDWVIYNGLTTWERDEFKQVIAKIKAKGVDGKWRTNLVYKPTPREWPDETDPKRDYPDIGDPQWDWSTVRKWVIFCKPRARGEARKGKKFNAMGKYGTRGGYWLGKKTEKQH